MGKGGKATLISESGLYKLIMRSNKPAAKEFQDWVTKEVLPSINATGSYVTGQPSKQPSQYLQVRHQGHSRGDHQWQPVVRRL